MQRPFKTRLFIICVYAALYSAPVHGQNLQFGGVALLQALGTNLNGAGIRVGQPEAVVDTNNDWEVDPVNVGQPTNLFTWYTNNITSTIYTNTLGGDSWHADNVGQIFYDPRTGVATNVAHVDNGEADDYYNYNIANDRGLVGSVTDAIVNQSFTFGLQDAGTQEMIDTQYDNFSMKFKTLFVSAACNHSIDPTVRAPGTSYNCISVGAFRGDSSVGPTIDNGRCKPDITAYPPSWGPETSFSTPMVAGAAAILMQAAGRGDGGSDTNSAAKMLTIKALLINGAVKPADWTNVPPSPLDYRYGSGVMNAFNSYEQLAFGKHGYNAVSTNISVGGPHPPVVITASIPVLSGWDYNTNTSSSTNDTVNHYVFNVTNSTGGAAFTLTATLAWNRHYNQTAINNLALFLYNAANSNLVAASTSLVDNVQHVYVPRLAQGRYDLQVWKVGGSFVTNAEPYALAWGIFSESLTVQRAGTNIALSWPAYPAGFAVASAANLNSPIVWSTNNIPPPVFTNNQMVLWLSPANSAQFFRLQTPDF